MRRRPSQFGPHVGEGLNESPPALPLASELGDAIEPFLASGGRTFWQTLIVPAGEGTQELLPQYGGVQLLAAVYVPQGKCAFVKRVVAAPTVPSLIGDAFRNHGLWTDFTALPGEGLAGGPVRAASHFGLWETPLAWEGYVQPNNEGDALRPQWDWHVTTMPGDWQKERAKLVPRNLPFSRTNFTTWVLALDEPVSPGFDTLPAPFTQNVRIYGNPIRGLVGPQRVPVLPRDDFSPHWFVPQNQSILLWARWRQLPMELRAADLNGPIQLAESFFPLGPSIGQLSGYMQSIQSEPAIANAQEGWGG